MASDNSELSPNIISLEHQLLDASLLLEKWVKWGNTFGSLMFEQRNFVQLQKDTEKFFDAHKKRE